MATGQPTQRRNHAFDIITNLGVRRYEGRVDVGQQRSPWAARKKERAATDERFDVAHVLDPQREQRSQLAEQSALSPDPLHEGGCLPWLLLYPRRDRRRCRHM
jgi:hypothetical protein